MKVIQVKLSDLKPAEYNPRSLDKKEAKDLKTSLERFGMVEPIVVNKAKERMNVIIGGHQRYNIWKELGNKTMPVVYVDIPGIKKERELNLRLNKNVGRWDWDMLANFDEDMLKDVGFLESDLMSNFSLSDAEVEEIELDRLNVITVEMPECPVLKERLAFYCDNEEEYKKIKKFFKKSGYRLDKDKLLKVIK